MDLAPGQEKPLWANGAPGAKGNAEEDIPTLTYYAPVGGNPSGTAVIVTPGGGYVSLAMNHEGRQVANWWNAHGVAAFVLKYRLGPKYHYPVELEDAQRAIRTVRANAKEFGVDPERIGMMGFSAGGHLTAMAATLFDDGKADASDPIDRVSSRPDFVVLAYPVILMTGPKEHQGSEQALLGENASEKLREEVSPELHVTAKTPPAFLYATSDDGTVPVENSVAFYSALHKAGVSAELHIFETGPHGVGLDLANPSLGQWPALLTTWMRERGLFAKGDAK
jgi:acetyl esterase/lipase